MLKFRENAMILSWIKLSLLLSFKQLEFEETLKEHIIAFNYVQINLEKCLNTLEALCELGHSCVVKGVSSMCILLAQDLSQPIKQISRILLQHILHSNIEFFMPLDSVCIVKHCRHKLPMLDVHVFEAVSVLFTIELIEQCLFHVHSLDV